MDRKKKEKNGGFTPAEYRTIVENQTEFIVRWKPDGVRTFVNDPYCRYFGLSREEAVGTSFFPLVSPADMEKIMQKLESLSPDNPSATDEHAVLRSDGSRGWQQWTDRAIFDEEGRIVELLSVGRDVTERRQTEEELERLSEAHRLALESADLGTWDCDLISGRFFGDERCRMIFGVPEKESLSAEKVLEIIHPEDRDRISQAVLSARSPTSDGRYRAEYRIVRADGRVYWVHARGQVVFEGEGVLRRPIRFTGLVMDVTARKRMERDLVSAKETAEEASRAKSRFLANMSHELRTPLSVIMASVGLLKKSAENVDRNRFLEMADESAHQLLGIINDLLEISKTAPSSPGIEERPIDLRECVRRTVEMFRSSARKKKVRLRWTVDSGLPERVSGDALRLGQVLSKLVGNAVKFTAEGEVSVGVEEADGLLQFTVRDTGIGIPEEKIEYLFQPFMQVDSSLTRPFGGAGLGLAVSRELAEMMGGRIEVESRVGQGSTFVLTIPFSPVAVSDAPVSEESPGTARPLHLLLVEDDASVRELLLTILRGRSFTVSVAENGKEAVSRWREEDIDLILMDLQMPEMNGLDATRKIRELEGERGGHTCIFALTAHVRDEDRQACLDAGMDGFIGKPFSIEEVESVIGSCPCGRETVPEDI